jgi:hypothetical protein
VGWGKLPSELPCICVGAVLETELLAWQETYHLSHAPGPTELAFKSLRT